MKYSETSLKRLGTCHHKLQVLFKTVLPEADHSIICGFRSEADQNKAFDEGFSKVRYPNSKHNQYPSRAVDVVPYDHGIDWKDVDRFKRFAEVVKKNADCLGIKVRWGGDWESFRDYPHWELDKEEA
jgi:peptidoglycan L-alanyl-D-glutamate endopeptidase CwlK